MTRELCPCGEIRDDFGACWKCDRPRVACADEPTIVRNPPAGRCTAHGSWVSATGEGCPTCSMLANLPTERVCVLCLRKWTPRLGDLRPQSRTCVGCRVATRSSADEDHPSPRDESWVDDFNSEQAI